jgi:chromosome segregation ATPase
MRSSDNPSEHTEPNLEALVANANFESQVLAPVRQHLQNIVEIPPSDSKMLKEVQSGSEPAVSSEKSIAPQTISENKEVSSAPSSPAEFSEGWEMLDSNLLESKGEPKPMISNLPLEKSVEELQLELSSLQKKYAELTEELSVAQSSVVGEKLAKETSNVLNEDLQKSQAALQAELGALQIKQSELIKELFDAKSNVLREELEKQALNALYKDLQESQATLEAELGTLQTKHNELQASYESQTKVVDGLEASNHLVALRMNELQVSYQNQIQRVSDMEICTNLVNSQMKALGEMLEHKERQLLKEQDAFFALQSKHLPLKESHEQLVKEYDLAQVHSNELSSNIEDLQANLQQSEKTLQAEREASKIRIENLQNELQQSKVHSNELSSNIEDLQAKLQQSEKTLQTEREASKIRIENLQNELQKSNVNYQEQEKISDAMIIALKNTNQLIDKSLEECESLKEKLAAVTKQKEELESAIIETRMHVSNTIKTLHQKLDQAKKSYQAQQQEAEKMQNALKQEIVQLKKDHEKLKENAQQQLQFATAKIISFELSARESQSRNQDLALENQALSNEIPKLQNKYQSQLDSLGKEHLEELNSLKAQLKKAVFKKNQAKKALRAEKLKAKKIKPNYSLEQQSISEGEFKPSSIILDPISKLIEVKHKKPMRQLSYAEVASKITPEDSEKFKTKSYSSLKGTIFNPFPQLTKEGPEFKETRENIHQP